MFVSQCLEIVCGHLGWGGFISVSYGKACQLIPLPLPLHIFIICASSRIAKNCCYTYSLKLRIPLAPSHHVVIIVLCNWTSYMVPLYWTYNVGETLINRPHGTTLLSLDRLSWHLIFGYFSKICRENSRFIKVWQEYRVLYMTTYVRLW